MTERQTIKSIVRGQLRYNGTEPTNATPMQVIRTLDELARDTGTVQRYYLTATDKQVKRLANEIVTGNYS